MKSKLTPKTLSLPEVKETELNKVKGGIQTSQYNINLILPFKPVPPPPPKN